MLKILKKILPVFLAIIIALLFLFLNPFQKLQYQLSNYLYQTQKSSHPIILVGIENKTYEKLSNIEKWSKNIYADIFKNILENNPKVIGLDIFLQDKTRGIPESYLPQLMESKNATEEIANFLPDKTHPEDQILKTLITLNKNVILVPNFFPKTTIYQQTFTKDSLGVVTPYKDFYSSESQIGYNKAFPSSDGFIRQIPLTYNLEGQVKDSFAKKIAEIYLQKPLDQAIQNIPLENGEMLINYREKPFATLTEAANSPNFTYISFIDLYENKLTQEQKDKIKDSIVLIGAYNSLDSQDKHLTPISPTVPMPGVMIHAQAIQTILDQAWLKNSTPTQTALTIFALIILTSLIIYLLKVRFALPLILLLSTTYSTIYAQFLFDRLGHISNLIYPNFAIIIATILTYTSRYLFEFRRGQILETGFQKFVDKSVVEKTLQNETATTTAEKKEITVLFSDIAGFTTISEKLQPQSLVELLNEYLNVMTSIVIKNGGTVDKFEGDAIMCFFEKENHAFSAAQTSLEMKQALQMLNTKFQTDAPLSGGEKKPQLEFRIGLSTGQAIIGNIGSENRLSYTAMGDIVNLGSRLESINKKYGTTIMISEKTFSSISSKFACRFADFIKVKGKNEAVKIFELIVPIDQINSQQKELITLFNQGLTFYFNHQFSEAKNHFDQSVLPKFPKDQLSLVYAGRCELLTRFPPKPDWDFVYEMKSK